MATVTLGQIVKTIGLVHESGVEEDGFWMLLESGCFTELLQKFMPDGIDSSDGWPISTHTTSEEHYPKPITPARIAKLILLISDSGIDRDQYQALLESGDLPRLLQRFAVMGV